MLSELEVLKDVCAKLDRAGIAYMLTGSMAMSYYAQPRMTRDIDFVVAIERDQIQDLLAVFEPEYYVPKDQLEQCVASRGMFNLLHLDSVVKVDFVVRKDDLYRLTEFGRRQLVSLSGFDARIVTREDLVLSKLVWAKDSESEQQLRDVRNLLSSDLDLPYVHKWATSLEVDDLLARVLSERHDT